MLPMGLLGSVFDCSVEAQLTIKNKDSVINIFFIGSIYSIMKSQLTQPQKYHTINIAK
jgi:hypothetical protein